MSPRPKIGLEISFIIEAAGELADQHGVQEVTLANLAKKLGFGLLLYIIILMDSLD